MSAQPGLSLVNLGETLEANAKPPELMQPGDLRSTTQRVMRDTLRVREEVVLAARTTAIGWVRSSFFPRPPLPDQNVLLAWATVLALPTPWQVC
jgi:hypothetical protein